MMYIDRLRHVVSFASNDSDSRDFAILLQIKIIDLFFY